MAATDERNTPETKDIKPIVQGHVKKKGFGEKAAEVFLSEDTKNVKDYVLWDILIPGIKNAFADIVIGGIEMALFGSTRSSRTGSSRRGGSETRVSYRSYYDNDRDIPGRSRIDRSGSSDVYDFSNIILDSRGDAESVIVSMEELIKRYGDATVADLCSLVGVSSRHTDNNYGWTDCRDFGYRRAGRGYVLTFAKPIYLGN